MPGKRTLGLTVVLAVLLIGGNYLVPRVYRAFQRWSLNRQLGDAIQKWDLARAEKLITEGADVNLRVEPVTAGPFGIIEPPQSAIGLAAKRWDAEAVQRLLQQGADVNLRDSNGATPLMLAAPAGGLPLTPLLLGIGVSPSTLVSITPPP